MCLSLFCELCRSIFSLVYSNVCGKDDVFGDDTKDFFMICNFDCESKGCTGRNNIPSWVLNMLCALLNVIFNFGKYNIDSYNNLHNFINLHCC